MSTTETGSGALHRDPGPPRRGSPGCCRAGAPSSTTSCGPACSTPASCAARSPAPGSAASTPRRRWRCPGCRPCSPPPTSTPGCTSSGTRRWARTCPTRRGRRWPRARSASSATRWRWWSPSTGTSPRTRSTWSTSTTTRCRRWSTTSLAHGHRAAGARRLPGQRRRLARRGRRRSGSPACSSRRAHDVGETIYQQAYAPVPMETRGMVAEWSGEELTVWAATQAPHEVRMFLARLLGIGEHQVRVIMRDTGGGFGQKVVPMREDMCIALAALQLPCALKWIEDRRENLLAAGHVPPRARRRPHGVRRRRPDRRRLHRPRAGRRRLPDAVAGGHRGRGRDAVPRAVPGARRRASGRRRCSPTPPVGRPTAGRGSSSRWPARCCSTSRRAGWASTRSSCGAATCCAATSCRAPTPTACPTATSRRSRPSSRRWRCSTTTAFRREQAEARDRGPVPGRRHVHLRRADHDGHGLLRHRGRHHPHRALGQGQRLRRRRLDRQQPRDHRRPAHRRRPRRRHRRRRAPSRATPRSPRSAPAPAAAAAGR